MRLAAGKLARLRKGSGPLRRLLLLATAQVLFSAAYIALFAATFSYGRRLVVIHLLLVAGLTAGFMLPAVGGVVCLRDAARRWPVRLALSFVPAAAATLQVVLYAADFLSNHYWGDNLFYALVADSLRRPVAQLRALPFNLVWPLVAAVAAVALLMAGYAFWLMRALDGLVSGLAARGWVSRRVALKWWAVASLLVVGYTAVIVRQADTFRVSRREPVVSFFTLGSHFAADAHRLAVAAADARSRQQYRGVRRDFEKRNVVLIIADCLRADHMQVYGYGRETTPFLAKLAEGGRLRRVARAFSTCSASFCGIMSTLASRHFRSLSPTNFKLHDLLGDQGYRRYFLLSGNHTSWHGLKQYYGEGIDLFFDGVSTQRHAPTDDRLIFEGLERVPAATDEPAFFYFHLLAAHQVGIRSEAYQKFRPAELNLVSDLLDSGGYEAPRATNSYDNGILQADATIGEIFASLERKGYLANSLVVITGDHGQGLGEHGSFGHTKTLYQEEIQIPLLIYDDARAAYPNLEFAGQVDIAPTVVDRLGLPVPQGWESRSLLNPEVKRHSYHQTERERPWRAVIERTDRAIYKYLRSEEDGREELYELLSDAGERHNLIGKADPAVVRRLRATLANSP